MRWGRRSFKIRKSRNNALSTIEKWPYKSSNREKICTLKNCFLPFNLRDFTLLTASESKDDS